MTSQTSFSSIEEKLYLANRAQPRPEFLAGLRTQIIERPPAPPSLKDRIRLVFNRPVWVTSTIIVLALAITMVIIGPQRVVAAIRQMFGYIPGVGVVDTSESIRVLSEPISVTRDEVSITVTSAVLTADSTHVDYRIFGVPDSAYPEREDEHGCWSQPYLRLPDGTQLDPTNNGYPPIPAEVNEAVFVIPCIGNTLPGKVPENWELPLSFVPAPPDFTVVPVIESLPSPTPTNIVNTNTPAPEINPLTITSVLDVGDKYVLMGELNNSAVIDASLPADSWWVLDSVSIIDADGIEIPPTYSNDFERPTPTAPDRETWVYQLDKKFIPPVTITYTGTIISPTGPKEQVEFKFDAGTNPQDGYAWPVDQDFELGGYNIRLLSIEAGKGGYTFNFKGDPGASTNMIRVDIVGYTPNCGGGGGVAQFPEEFSRNVCYGYTDSTEFPHGEVTAVINFQALTRQTKSFRIEWDPDTTQTGPFATSTPQPGVCLDAALLAKLGPAPADLTNGTALFYEQLDDTGQWGLVLYSLDGSQRQVLVADASGGALSSDGSRMAYSSSDGIHVLDLGTQTEKVLTGVNGFDLHWQADGQYIEYVGIEPDGIYVVNVDDAQVYQISNQSYGAIVGWSSNNTRLYYVIPFTGGAAWNVYEADLSSGSTRELFTIENGSYKNLGAALSPDGTRIVYRGRDGSSLYVVRLDGSDLHLLLDNPAAGTGGVVWIRSGWLGVSMQKMYSEETSVVLLRPDDCQVYLLPALHGNLLDMTMP